MSIFGPVVGGDLPLLSLPLAKVARLSGQKHADFNEQVEHHCIRRAWIIAQASGRPVSDILDIEAGRASIKISEIFGFEVSEGSIGRTQDSARGENEWGACFGLHLAERIQRVMAADAEVGEESCGLNFYAKLVALEGLNQSWKDLKGIYAGPYDRATALIAQNAAGRDGFIDHCKPLQWLIKHLGVLVKEIERQENRRFLKEVHLGLAWEGDTVTLRAVPFDWASQSA